MPRPLRIAGLFLASLTIVTVALAQQSGSQGRIALPAQSPKLAAVMLPEDGKARLSRMREQRHVHADCPAGVCDTPPKLGQAAQASVPAQASCGNQDTGARDRNGRAIRRICQFN